LSARRSFAWRIALGLAAHAAHILPLQRREWSSAMISEVDHLPSAGAAIRWAMGCIIAGYIERIRMSRSLRHLSRWVLSLEMLLCFVPVTWLFAAVISSSIHAMPSLPTALLFVSATLVGPVGLMIAAKTLVFRQAVGRITSAALCVLALWTFATYLALIFRNPSALSSGWRDIVLIAVLPGLAAVHLAFMASEAASEAPRSSATA
jgi:hypothetical protein